MLKIHTNMVFGLEMWSGQVEIGWKVLKKGKNNTKMVKIRAHMVDRIQWDLRIAKDNKGHCNNVKVGYMMRKVLKQQIVNMASKAIVT
jgi:hypothetical protein